MDAQTRIPTGTAFARGLIFGTVPGKKFPVTAITARGVVLVQHSTQNQPEYGMETMWQQTVRITIAGVMVWAVSVLAFAVAR